MVQIGVTCEAGLTLTERMMAGDFAFDGAPGGYRVTPPHPATTFTPEGLAATGTR